MKKIESLKSESILPDLIEMRSSVKLTEKQLKKMTIGSLIDKIGDSTSCLKILGILTNAKDICIASPERIIEFEEHKGFDLIKSTLLCLEIDQQNIGSLNEGIEIFSTLLRITAQYSDCNSVIECFCELLSEFCTPEAISLCLPPILTLSSQLPQIQRYLSKHNFDELLLIKYISITNLVDDSETYPKMDKIATLDKVISISLIVKSFINLRLSQRLFDMKLTEHFFRVIDSSIKNLHNENDPRSSTYSVIIAVFSANRGIIDYLGNCASCSEIDVKGYFQSLLMLAVPVFDGVDKFSITFFNDLIREANYILKTIWKNERNPEISTIFNLCLKKLLSKEGSLETKIRSVLAFKTELYRRLALLDILISVYATLITTSETEGEEFIEDILRHLLSVTLESSSSPLIVNILIQIQFKMATMNPFALEPLSIGTSLLIKSKLSFQSIIYTLKKLDGKAEIALLLKAIGVILYDKENYLSLAKKEFFIEIFSIINLHLEDLDDSSIAKGFNAILLSTVMHAEYFYF